MNKPVLVIMAAGMGSRYGGLKQMDPIDENGNMIIDYSVYDAKQAGFEKVIFIIKKEIEQEFKNLVGNRLSNNIEVEYVYQNLQNIPTPYVVPKDRVKPWGTAHAVLTCKEVIDGPFAVINADDFYGRQAFKEIYGFLNTTSDDLKYRYTMVGYELHNTVTENGHVARGVCQVNEENLLMDITERTQIEMKDNGIAFTEDAGQTWEQMQNNTIVSMNMWGFTKSILKELDDKMAEFLEIGLKENPTSCEYFLPSIVSQLLHKGEATAKVLHTPDKWYGVTYKEDKPTVVSAIKALREQGTYPTQLWEKK